MKKGRTDDVMIATRTSSRYNRRMVMFVFLALVYGATILKEAPPLLPSLSVITEKEEANILTTDAAANEDRRYHNVLLQGQFNFETSPDLVQGWVQAWSKYFSNIMVVGPFSPNTRAELTQLNISVRAGRADQGLNSPYENLMLTLLEYKHHPTIEGVFYLHDDALINLTRFTSGMYPFPTDAIVGTLRDDDPSDGLFTIHVTGGEGGKRPKVSYSKDGHYYYSQETMHAKLRDPDWWRLKGCLPPLTDMILDPETAHMMYNNNSGSSRANYSYEIAEFAQSDVLFVPTRLADAFAHQARPFVGNKIFMECAFPTIIHHMLKEKNISSQRRTVELCTSWNYKGLRKNGKRMVQNCIKTTENGYGVYHPVKISALGVKEWVNILDSVQNTTA